MQDRFPFFSSIRANIFILQSRVSHLLSRKEIIQPLKFKHLESFGLTSPLHSAVFLLPTSFPAGTFAFVFNSTALMQN